MSLIDDEDVRAILRHPWLAGPPPRTIDIREEPLNLDKNDVFYKYRAVTVDVEYQNKVAPLEPLKDSFKFVVKVPQCRKDSDSSEPLTLQNVLADESTTQEEVHFFDKVYPLMTRQSFTPRWHPVCFLAKPGALVFDDRTTSIHHFRWDEYHDEAAVKAILESLAYFHAASLILESRLGQPLNLAYPNAFREKVFAGSGRRARATKVGFDALALLAEKFDMDAGKILKIYEHICETVKPKKGGCNVVCHGNLQRSCLGFNRGDDSKLRCVLLNYELLRYSSPATDLAALLHSRRPPEMLDELEDDLVELYTARLRGTLRRGRAEAKMPSYEAVREDYEANKLAGMACAAVEWPAGVLAGLSDDPVALEECFFRCRIDRYLASMEEDPDYENRMKCRLKRLFSEAERLKL